MRASYSFLLTPILVATIITSTGCSWFSSGDGEGSGELSESDLASQREGRFGMGNIPTAEGEGMFRDVHFNFDSYAVEEESHNDLEANDDNPRGSLR